ncbi:MAG: hypothetical protein AB1716_03715 [Planctomycetota bacterium]
MHRGRGNWVVWVVLAVGCGLRLGLAAVMPASLAYDDHFTPIRKIAREVRLPRPDECWECYQPPLYYVTSASVFAGVEKIALAVGAAAPTAEETGRKAVQFLSAIAGCATLLVCMRILRQVRSPSASGGRGKARPEAGNRSFAPEKNGIAAPAALGLAVAAVLPQHVYMSAMITNDAFTYLVASLAISAALWARAAGWPVGRTLLTGALAGAAILSKGYGVVTAASILAVMCAAALVKLVLRSSSRGPAVRVSRAGAQRDRAADVRATEGAGPPDPRPVRAVLLVAAVVLALGVWPSARNLALYGRTHVDNFDFFRTAMQAQPPGSVAAIDWTSFRIIGLLQRPWLHARHVDSFWTEVYARYWFEYEGIVISLRNSAEWSQFRDRILRQTGRWNAEAWRAMLRWGAEDVPTDLRRVAVVSYIGGLPLTAFVLAGFVLSARRLTSFAWALLVVHFIACLFVPVFQTLRLPYFAAMKSAFTLSALSSAPLFVAECGHTLRGNLRRLGLVTGWSAAALVAAADAAYIVIQWRA